MKKEFLTPEISVCTFSAEDIITASGMQTASEIVAGKLKADTVVSADWAEMTSAKE